MIIDLFHSHVRKINFTEKSTFEAVIDAGCSNITADLVSFVQLGIDETPRGLLLKNNFSWINRQFQFCSILP